VVVVKVDKERISRAAADSARMIATLGAQTDVIAAICGAVIDSLKAGNKILTAGNGGSAAEALHMSEEFVGRFRTNRISLPAICLCGDPTALTCIGNDFGYDALFSRQIEGYARPGDLLVVFSTSGKAPNLKNAVEAARARGMKTVCLLGRDGGPMRGIGDLELVVEGEATERIQEVHQVVMHMILDAVEMAYS
jgi:D-sedoheptulose 7-phosphate isomerase